MSKYKIGPGVATGDDVKKIFSLAKENAFALPAVNVVGTNSINAVLETAAKLNSPVIIQFSNGGAHFNAGKSLQNKNHETLLLVQFLEHSMFIVLQKIMVQQSFCTRTTLQKNYFHGLMVY